MTEFKIAAEFTTGTEISLGFPTRDDALHAARATWKSMKARDVHRVAIVPTCGTVETLWRAPADPTTIPTGYYSVDGKRYHVSRPVNGKWQGWTFLATGSDYHDRRTLATVNPAGTVIRTHDVLNAILADPFARAAEYGQITGTCAACGRKLEDPVSRSIGLGPICRQKFGA